MLRSPSHESVTAVPELKLFGATHLAAMHPDHGRMRLIGFKSHSEAQLLQVRGPSPNPDSKPVVLQPNIPEGIWFEEENDLIKSCAQLSSALGFQKSFSTSDISNLPSPDETPIVQMRNAVSELVLNALQRSGFMLDQSRLEHASRSCSTWVAVGDVASTSQLPSPHGGHANLQNPPPPAGNVSSSSVSAVVPPAPFTAADLVRSVNKKVRQNYIRRRLLTTYKALERLSKSEFNLDRLEVPPVSSRSNSGTHLAVPGAVPSTQSATTSSSLLPPNVVRLVKPQTLSKNIPITLCDVDIDRGKQLTKFERHMMIFNWLHTLDGPTTEVTNDI